LPFAWKLSNQTGTVPSISWTFSGGEPFDNQKGRLFLVSSLPALEKAEASAAFLQRREQEHPTSLSDHASKVATLPAEESRGFQPG
jgi:hypothetical protein